MTITIEQQREYIDKVAQRVINDELDRLAGIYRIDAMVELEPKLHDYAHKAIANIYEHANLTAIDPRDQ